MQPKQLQFSLSQILDICMNLTVIDSLTFVAPE